MCSPRVLHHSEIGLVRYCERCSHYQLAFGTIVFTLSDDEFTQFIAEVNLIRGIDTNCTIKDIWIDLPYEDVGLLLDTKELNKLKELLKASLYIENLNLLLQTLKISGPK